MGQGMVPGSGLLAVLLHKLYMYRWGTPLPHSHRDLSWATFRPCIHFLKRERHLDFKVRTLLPIFQSLCLSLFLCCLVPSPCSGLWSFVCRIGAGPGPCLFPFLLVSHSGFRRWMLPFPCSFPSLLCFPSTPGHPQGTRSFVRKGPGRQQQHPRRMSDVRCTVGQS